MIKLLLDFSIYIQGSGNVDPSGNFSIEVLRAALSNEFGLTLPNIRQQAVLSDRDVTDVNGFICNRESHWFAIRKINGRYWNLNSMQDRPEIISHFRLAAEIQGLQDAGYSVFVVPPGEELPPECRASAMRERGLPEFWWREEDLVKGKSDAVTGATDPWRNVGSGMRLDGRSTGGSDNAASPAASSSPMDLGDLTEEEMLQMAMQASVESEVQRATAQDDDDDIIVIENTTAEVPVPPEPDVSEKDGVRIQFRLPGGERVVRRFRKTDLVGGVYSYVKEQSSSGGGGGKLELRAGFPPVDLSERRSQTIEEAKLSGESVQCRYL